MIIDVSNCFNRYNFRILVFLPIQLNQCLVVAPGENPNSGIHQMLGAVYRITDIREPCLFWGDARLPSGGGLCVSYQSRAGLQIRFATNPARKMGTFLIY